MLPPRRTETARRRLRFVTRGALLRLGILFLALAGLAVWALSRMTSMPGTSFRGPLDPPSASEKTLAAALKAHVIRLATEIGPRDLAGSPRGLEAAASYVESELGRSGLAVMRQSFKVGEREVHNLEIELRGAARSQEIVVVGAHYDTCGAVPGANDNASGVAALLELARRFAARPGPSARTLRFVAFVNEEPPYFQTELMGSLVYARRSRERREEIVAMLSLETLGYYSDEPASQNYPPPFGLLYPSVGNFIAFVGDAQSGDLVRRAVGTFRASCRFPSEAGAIPASVPGVGWSDHWSFRQVGYPALMVTDTAPFRYPHYHAVTDTAEKLDYERLARVVEGLEKVIEDLARGEGI